jgi:hypothetical protein
MSKMALCKEVQQYFSHADELFLKMAHAMSKEYVNTAINNNELPVSIEAPRSKLTRNLRSPKEKTAFCSLTPQQADGEFTHGDSNFMLKRARLLPLPPPHHLPYRSLILSVRDLHAGK